MWIKIFFAGMAFLALSNAADSDSKSNRQRLMHMSSICLASIIALAVVVIYK